MKYIVKQEEPAAFAEDDVNRFVSGYLQRNSSGMYGEFWTTIS